MVKTKKLFKIAIVTLSIVAVSIIILAVWISRDDYVPQKLGNSVSAALNNRYRLRYGCSIAENSDYIFYVNRSNNNCQLFRINKKSGEKTLLMSDVGDRNSGSLFIYKKSIIYAKSKDKNYQEFYYDIYSSDFDGKNVKLIKKECEAPHMVIDDWIYFPGKDNSLSRISLVNGKERNVSGLECDKFVGIDKMNRNLYWFTEASYLTKLKINNRRTDLFLKNSNEKLAIQIDLNVKIVKDKDEAKTTFRIAKDGEEPVRIIKEIKDTNLTHCYKQKRIREIVEDNLKRKGINIKINQYDLGLLCDKFDLKGNEKYYYKHALTNSWGCSQQLVDFLTELFINNPNIINELKEEKSENKENKT